MEQYCLELTVEYRFHPRYMLSHDVSPSVCPLKGHCLFVLVSGYVYTQLSSPRSTLLSYRIVFFRLSHAHDPILRHKG